MGGLQAQSTALATGSSGTGTEYVALDADHPANNAGTYDVESHLDSFFDGSGWTREDVHLVLQVVTTALVVYAVLEAR